MADDISRAPDKKSRARSTPKPTNFENVEFLDSSLADPMNVLRSKIKELSLLPEGAIRRVIVITEIVSEEGRGLDVSWSEGEEESGWVVQDSLVSILTRVSSVITSED